MEIIEGEKITGLLERTYEYCNSNKEIMPFTSGSVPSFLQLIAPRDHHVCESLKSLTHVQVNLMTIIQYIRRKDNIYIL